MTKYKIITGFSTYTDDEFGNKTSHVEVCMTDNAYFPDADPLLVNLRSCNSIFNTTNAKTNNNTKEGTAAKRQARSNADDCLKAVAAHVQMNGKNDPVILLSSGFDLQKAKTPIGVLDKPENLRAKHVDGIEGSVKLMIAPVAKANGYLWLYAETPITDASTWVSALTTAATITLALKNRTEYTFKVTATGSDPTQTFSNKLTFFVV
jgi:hypothetical protein